MATYKTLVLDVETIQGNSLAGATVYVSYDRTVRLSSGGIVPDPAGAGVAVPVTGTASVQVLASDDPDLATDSAGFGIKVRVVWTEAPTWRQQSKSYVAQVVSADASSVNLSAKIGAQPVPTQLVDMSTVLADASSSAANAASSAASAAASAALVGAPADTAIATAVNGSGTATQTALDGRYVQPSGVTTSINAARGLSSTNYITVGTTNHTSEIQALLNDAYNSGGSLRQARIAPGVYTVEGLTIPDLVTIEAESHSTSRYSGLSTSPTFRYGAVTLKRPNSSTSTNPIVTMSGSGSGLRGITLDGNGNSTGVGLVSQGFETELNSVRIINQASTAWDVQKANNARWHDIYIDHCGGTSAPAVTFRSVSGTGQATLTNNVVVHQLTIEEAAGVALAIGVGGTTADYWSEFVTFTELHIESRSPGGTWNTVPCVQIGASRAITFDNPMIVGGPGYLIEHDHPAGAAQSTYSNSGLLVIGGDLIGSDTTQTSPPASTPYAVHLVNGNDFRMIGTRFGRITTANVLIESTYGANAYVDQSATSTNGNTARMIADSRTLPTRRARHAEELSEQHIYQRNTYRPAPTVALYGNNGGGPTPTVLGTDTSCRISFGSGASPTAGAQVQLKYGTKYDGQQNVFITPCNALSAAAQAYVQADNNGAYMNICLQNPTASQAAGAYQFNVWVCGN